MESYANNIDKTIPFSQVTLNSLHQALMELSVSLPTTQSEIKSFNTTILKSYDALTPFPDAIDGIKSLSSSQNLVPFIFSNGDSSMLQASVHDSPHLKDHAKVFRDIVSVEETGKFKPCPEVYYHLARKVLNLDDNAEVDAKERGRIWLVSGNPFDIVGAKAVGLMAAWVDRESKGWTDRLMGLEVEGGKPDLIVKGVNDAVKGIESWYN
jgi:2-haloacid dehalogenase